VRDRRGDALRLRRLGVGTQSYPGNSALNHPPPRNHLRNMPTRQINVRRFSITSSKPFGDVVASIESAVDHPGMSEFARAMSAPSTYAEMEGFLLKALAKTGFMEFARYDPGAVLRKELGPGAPRIVRFVIGNPLIMKEMAKHVPDVGSYAPVNILVDERPDGVHLSYDEMASLLAPYENEEALKVARNLDAKIEKLLTDAAA
jgi:uncharacterized protein (DUF302 family)